MIFNALNIQLNGKTTGQIKTICPVCSKDRKKKSDPCLSVNIDTGAYNCHNCGAKGNIHKYNRPDKVYVKPVWHNRTQLSDKVVKWFEWRGISQATLKAMRITEGREWMPQAEAERNVIEFNYFRGDELINVKYRDAEKNFKLVKDAERTWYNHDAIYNETLYIVEGEIDVLTFVECGFDNVVSVPNGASNFDFFDPEQLDKINHVYIAVDNDERGLQLRYELARRIGYEKCYWVDWGAAKDANEYLVKFGRIAFAEAVKRFVEFPVDGIVYVKDVYSEIADLYQNGIKLGKKIRHSEFSNHMTLETGRLMVVTGIPSHGKSEAVDEILEQMAVLHGWRSAYFSPENWPVQLHVSKLAAKVCGRWLQQMTIDQLDNVMEYLNDMFYWIMPEDDEYSLDTILSKARILITKYGVKAVVIDPWNTVSYDLDGMTETQYVNKALAKMTMFARKHDVLLVLVAHPVKMEKKSDGKYEVPSLYSINGSSHFYNKADFGLTVYRDMETDEVEWHITKVKFRHLGRVGIVRFVNNPKNGRYEELTHYKTLGYEKIPHIETIKDEPEAVTPF